MSHGVRRYDGVDDRRGSLSRPATERQPLRTLVVVVCRAPAVRCVVPLAQQRVLVVVLNLAAGIAHFQDCGGDVSWECALVSLRTLVCALLTLTEPKHRPQLKLRAVYVELSDDSLLAPGARRDERVGR